MKEVLGNEHRTMYPGQRLEIGAIRDEVTLNYTKITNREGSVVTCGVSKLSG